MIHCVLTDNPDSTYSCEVVVSKEKWIQIGDKWKYEHLDGSFTFNNWEKIDDLWYYYDKDGYMMTGWQNISGKDYYFYPDGHMAFNEKIDGYYLGPDGAWIYNKKRDCSKVE